MKTKFLLAMLLVSSVLVGCGPKNPLIGKWESDPIMGVSQTVEFKSGSMVNEVQGVSHEAKVDYKVEKERVGIVFSANDQGATLWFDIVDDKTIEQNSGLVKFRFHRK